MTKRRGRKTVEKGRFTEYQNVAEHFYNAPKDSIELEYWTAAGVLIVHSAIAYTDSLCIKLAGIRSSGEDHEDAIALLENSAAENEEKSKAISQLRRIIEEKTRVSYLGDLYSPAETNEMWKRLERFRKWALKILER